MEDMKAYTRVCKNCGKKLVSGAVFCGGCGTPVESEGPEPFPVYGENTRTAGGEKDGGSASFPVYGADTGAGTDSGYSLQAVFNRMPCQQFTPLYMFLYAYVAVLAIFGTAVVVLFPALNVHDMFTSFYDWVSRMKFFFAIITNLPCYSRVASELCIIFHFE